MRRALLVLLSLCWVISSLRFLKSGRSQSIGINAIADPGDKIRVRGDYECDTSSPFSKYSYSPFDNSNNDISDIAKLFTGIRRNIGNWNEIHGSIVNPFAVISEEQEHRISNILIKKGEYLSNSNLTEQRLHEINKFCTKYNVNIQQGLSLRKQLLINKASWCTGRIFNEFKTIENCYNGGKSLEYIGSKYDVPHVAVIRTILLARVARLVPSLRQKDCKSIVKRILRGVSDYEQLVAGLDEFKLDPESDVIPQDIFKLVFKQRDQEELVRAKQLDQISYSDDLSNEKRASSYFEEVLTTFLTANNVSYLVESDLRGTYPITPDVLITDDLYINGRLVRWIDVKNYFGASISKSFYNKLEKQIKRYNVELAGAGAVIFRSVGTLFTLLQITYIIARIRLGYSSALSFKFPDTLILDAGPIAYIDDEDLGYQNIG